MYLSAESTRKPASPWKAGLQCIAAIVLVLHWALPVLNAPLMVADALQDAVEYSLYERDSAPGALSRSSPHGAAVQASVSKRDIDFFKSGAKPAALPSDACPSLSVLTGQGPIVTLTSPTMEKTSSAFNARAPPRIVA